MLSPVVCGVLSLCDAVTCCVWNVLSLCGAVTCCVWSVLSLCDCEVLAVGFAVINWDLHRKSRWICGVFEDAFCSGLIMSASVNVYICKGGLKRE